MVWAVSKKDSHQPDFGGSDVVQKANTKFAGQKKRTEFPSCAALSWNWNKGGSGGVATTVLESNSGKEKQTKEDNDER